MAEPGPKEARPDRAGLKGNKTMQRSHTTAPEPEATAAPEERRRSPCVHRLRASPWLQRAFRQLHACGPQPVGMFIAELVDRLGADPTAIDFVLRWRTLHPDIVRALAGDFPPPPLEVVPR
jgi:hypothetical protein